MQYSCTQIAVIRHRSRIAASGISWHNVSGVPTCSLAVSSTFPSRLLFRCTGSSFDAVIDRRRCNLNTGRRSAGTHNGQKKWKRDVQCKYKRKTCLRSFPPCSSHCGTSTHVPMYIGYSLASRPRATYTISGEECQDLTIMSTVAATKRTPCVLISWMVQAKPPPPISVPQWSLLPRSLLHGYPRIHAKYV